MSGIQRLILLPRHPSNIRFMLFFDSIADLPSMISPSGSPEDSVIVTQQKHPRVRYPDRSNAIGAVRIQTRHQHWAWGGKIEDLRN